MTFAIIKPDAVRARVAGKILQRIEDEGFQIRAMRLVNLTKREAEGFYAVHRERPFFSSLTTFMSSGPAVVLALEAPDAIKKWRTLMGATDPAKADAGTLRKAIRPVDREQRDARVGCAGDGGIRVVVLLSRNRVCAVGRGQAASRRWTGHRRDRFAHDGRHSIRPVAGRHRDPPGQRHVLLSARNIHPAEYHPDATSGGAAPVTAELAKSSDADRDARRAGH